jgi:hypothetical protein
MKKKPNYFLLILLFNVGFCGVATAQLTTLPSGGNKKALVSEQVVLTDVTITYGRPAVKKKRGTFWKIRKHLCYLK